LRYLGLDPLLTEYLKAFTTLLFNKLSPSRPFKRIYIDGFAGSGSAD
jgi:hypothetical protein